MIDSAHKSERGAALIIVAASLLVLMGMVAIVIDGGNGFSERRQAQSGVDFGALAAAQFSLPPGVSAECPVSFTSLQLATCRGAVEAKAVVDGNLPGQAFTWDDWKACVDPSAPAKYSVRATVLIGGTPTPIDCIRFTSTTQEVRVVLPTLSVDTSFGRVLGVNELNLSAFAEVEGELPEEFDILPFGIPASASDHYDCIKSGANPDWGVCKDLPSTGNFGYLDIPTYGNDDMGTTSDGCNPTNNTLISNMVRGIDHGLGWHSTGTPTSADPAKRDDDGNNTADRLYVCPIFKSNANEVKTQTGNVSGAFDTGMTIGYGASERGGLWKDGGTHVRTGGGGNPDTFIDNDPLWNYLTNTSICPSGPPTNTAQMIECLEGWDPLDGVVFSSTIKNATRYGFAPSLYEDFSAASWYMIKGLRPIYLQLTYWGCGPATGNGCDMIHAPAESNTGPCAEVSTPTTGSEPPDTTCGVPQTHNKSLNALTSFVLDERMLPNDAIMPYTSEGPLINLFLTE